MAEMTDIETPQIELGFFRQLWQSETFDMLRKKYRNRNRRTYVKRFLTALKLDDDSLRTSREHSGAPVRQRSGAKHRPRPFPHRFEATMENLLTADRELRKIRREETGVFWKKEEIRKAGPLFVGAKVIYKKDFALGRITHTVFDTSENELHHARTKREAYKKARRQVDDALEGWPERRKRRNSRVLRQYGEWLCQHYVSGISYPSIARDDIVTVYAVKHGVHLAAEALNIDLTKRTRPPKSH